MVNQAIGTGLPVITSDAVGAGMDLVEDHVNGLRFPAGNVDELEKCMQAFVSSPDIIRQWGVASRTKAITLTPDVGAENWVHVFDTLFGTSITGIHSSTSP